MCRGLFKAIAFGIGKMSLFGKEAIKYLVIFLKKI